MNETILDLIIPCYNLEKWIGKCLSSLIEQKNELNIKRRIIFICDNCTDKTEDVIKEKMKNSNWEYEIYKANEGCAGGARNIGLAHSNSKYIWFVDGDDWLTSDEAIDTVMECMIKDDMDIVEFKTAGYLIPDGEFGMGTVWNAIYSTRIIGDYKFNRKLNGEDNDFYFEMRNRNPKLGKINYAPYFYNYPREGSLSDLAYHTCKGD